CGQGWAEGWVMPLRFAPVDFGLVMVPDVLFRTPAFVDSILPGSPAAKADIRPNDLVLFANDELVQSCKMFKEELGRLEAGDTLKLVIRRGNALMPVEFEVLKKRESATARPARKNVDDKDPKATKSGKKPKPDEDEDEE